MRCPIGCQWVRSKFMIPDCENNMGAPKIQFHFINLHFWEQRKPKMFPFWLLFCFFFSRASQLIIYCWLEWALPLERVIIQQKQVSSNNNNMKAVTRIYFLVIHFQVNWSAGFLSFIQTLCHLKEWSLKCVKGSTDCQEESEIIMWTRRRQVRRKMIIIIIIILAGNGDKEILSNNSNCTIDQT